jgi:hypothetical protein
MSAGTARVSPKVFAIGDRVVGERYLPFGSYAGRRVNHVPIYLAHVGGHAFEVLSRP